MSLYHSTHVDCHEMWKCGISYENIVSKSWLINDTTKNHDLTTMVEFLSIHRFHNFIPRESSAIDGLSLLVFSSLLTYMHKGSRTVHYTTLGIHIRMHTYVSQQFVYLDNCSRTTYKWLMWAPTWYIFYG
mgnify:CR=1 FL=1